MTAVLVYSILLCILSLITFALYAADKSKAKRKRWRIPEGTLIGLSLCGGAFGGYLGMHLLRHKTKHWYFHVFNLIGLTWQIALLVFFIVKAV